MKTELFVFKIRKVLWVKERFSEESYDILIFKDLPFKELLQLAENNKKAFLWNVSEILKYIACKIYICQIHYYLSDQAYSMLMSNSKRSLSNKELAEQWYELYFKSSLKGTPELYVDEEFAAEFETVLVRLASIQKRKRFLYSVNSYAFLSKAKKAQVERISEKLDLNFNELVGKYQYVGLYGLLIYMYTRFVQKFSDESVFLKDLGIRV
jgi:hypothetical protein